MMDSFRAASVILVVLVSIIIHIETIHYSAPDRSLSSCYYSHFYSSTPSTWTPGTLGPGLRINKSLSNTSATGCSLPKGTWDWSLTCPGPPPKPCAARPSLHILYTLHLFPSLTFLSVLVSCSRWILVQCIFISFQCVHTIPYLSLVLSCLVLYI